MINLKKFNIYIIGINTSAFILSLSTTLMSSLMMWSLQEGTVYQILGAATAVGLQIGQFCLPTILSSAKKAQSTMIVILSFFLLSTSVFASVFFLERTVQERIAPIIKNNSDSSLVKIAIERKQVLYDIKMGEAQRLISGRTYRSQGEKKLIEAEKIEGEILKLEQDLRENFNSQSYLPFYFRSDFEKERLTIFAIIGLFIDLCAMLCVYVGKDYSREAVRKIEEKIDEERLAASLITPKESHHVEMIALNDKGSTEELTVALTSKEPILPKLDCKKEKESDEYMCDSLDMLLVKTLKTNPNISSKVELIDIFYKENPSFHNLNVTKKSITTRVNRLLTLGYISIPKKKPIL